MTRNKIIQFDFKIKARSFEYTFCKVIRGNISLHTGSIPSKYSQELPYEINYKIRFILL
jgi:hypothetical protein